MTAENNSPSTQDILTSSEFLPSTIGALVLAYPVMKFLLSEAGREIVNIPGGEKVISVLTLVTTICLAVAIGYNVTSKVISGGK